MGRGLPGRYLGRRLILTSMARLVSKKMEKARTRYMPYLYSALRTCENQFQVPCLILR